MSNERRPRGTGGQGRGRGGRGRGGHEDDEDKDEDDYEDDEEKDEEDEEDEDDEDDEDEDKDDEEDEEDEEDKDEDEEEEEEEEEDELMEVEVEGEKCVVKGKMFDDIAEELLGEILKEMTFKYLRGNRVSGIRDIKNRSIQNGLNSIHADSYKKKWKIAEKKKVYWQTKRTNF